MESQKNPFSHGMEDALAGVDYKRRCPYAEGSRERTRYISGYQAGLDQKRRAARLAKEAQEATHAPL